MSSKPLSRVRWSVCALSLLLLAVSWGYFAVSFKRDHQTIEEHASQHIRFVALGLEEYTRRLFQTHDMVLRDIADSILTAGTAEHLHNLCADWLKRLPKLGALQLVDVASGEVLFEAADEPIDWGAEIVYPPLEQFSGTISDLQIAAVSKQAQNRRNRIVLWRQLRHADRQYLVIAQLRTVGLSNFYRSLELGERGVIAILHESGDVLAHEPLEGEHIGFAEADDTRFVSDLQAGSVGMAQLTVAGDENNRIAAYRKLTGFPLVVMVGDSTDWMLAGWQSRLKDFLIIQLVISFAILLATFFLVRALSNIAQAETKLHERERHFSAVANSTVDAVISVDAGQRIQFWSHGAERTFEVKRSDAQGELLSKFLHFGGEQSLAQTLDALARQGAAQQSGGTVEVQGIRSNRWTFPTELSVSFGTTGGKPFYTLIVRDVTERKIMEERIRRLASHDNLTRLPNRSLLVDRLDVAMAQVRRQGGQFALLFLDLDEFKPVNDTYGHEVGDQLLQQVAERLKATLRESDTVARVGGDEFAMLLNNVTDREAIASACENLLKALNRKFTLKQVTAQISGSIGAVLYTGAEIGSSDLIRQADMAMYAAKKSGKNRYLFSSDLKRQGKNQVS